MAKLTTGIGTLGTGRVGTGAGTGIATGVGTGVGTKLGTSVGTSIGAGASVGGLKTTAFVNVRDNTKFVTTFDNSKIVDVFKPTRILVVGQNPAPGTFVPVGTPVDLTLAVKDSLPLDGFKEIDPRVLAKFAGKNVGDVTASYRGTEAQKVLDREDAEDYDTLSTADKAVVNDYIKTTYGVDGATDAAGAKSLYGNVKFLNDL